MPIFGRLGVKKIREDDPNKPISGVKFEVLNEDKTTRARDIYNNELVGTTNSSGEIVWNNVELGTYWIHEIETVDGYYLDSSSNDAYQQATITGQNEAQLKTFQAGNIAQQWSLTLEKQDELTHEPLSGIVFDVTRVSGLDADDTSRPQSWVMTTGADGKASLPANSGLTTGKYHIKERVPSGDSVHYSKTPLLDEDFTLSTTDRTKKTFTYDLGTVNNKANPGWLDLYKVDDLNGNPIKGVQFDIYRYDNGTDIFKVTSEFDGITENPDTVLNGKTPVTTITTDANGYAKTGDLVKGLYVVVEKSVPEGYRADSRKIYTQIKVVSDETTHVTTESSPAKNRPIEGKLIIDKDDILTGEALAGCVFQIERVSGIPGRNDYIGVLPAEYNMVTDANGHAESKALTYGVYKIKEIETPEHYYDPAFTESEATAFRRKYPLDYVITVEVKNDNSTEEKTYPYTYTNIPTSGKVKLIKTDKLNENPIPGIQFEVYKYYTEDHKTVFETTDYPEYVCTITTDENGIALSPEIEKGCYYIVEKQPTPGYLFEKVEFDEVIVQSDEVTELTAVNKPVQIGITIYKRDVEEYTGETPAATSQTVGGDQSFEWIVGEDRSWTQTTVLPDWMEIQEINTRGDAVVSGAEFKVTAGADIKDRQGNVIFHSGDTVIESIKTGEDGSVNTGLLWPGVYNITETGAPEGYRDSDEVITVDTTGAAKQSFIEDVEYQALKLNKVKEARLALTKFLGDNEIHTGDALIEKPEKGATFEVFLASAGTYDEAREYERDLVTTDANGKCQTKWLPYGTYTVKQITPGEGAVNNAMKLPFNEDLKDDNKTYREIINNFARRAYIKIIKIDEETGKTITLAGVEFKVKDAEGNYITQTVRVPNIHKIDTYVTDDTGMTTMPESLECGTYYITEVKAPDGYLIPEGDYEVNMTPAKLDEEGEYDAVSGDCVLPVEIVDTEVKGHIQIEKKGLQLIGFEKVKDDATGYEYNMPVFENRYLAGCKFEIYAAEDIVGKEGTVWLEKDELADTIITTDHGPDENAKELHLGKYYVKEVSAPAGYMYDDTLYEVELKYADDKTPIVVEKLDINNRYLPVDLSAVKEKTDIIPNELENGMIHQVEIRLPGEGFVFGLYNKTQLTALDGTKLAPNSLLAVAAADAEGNIHLAGYMPHGEYYIQEIECAEGWNMVNDKFDVSLTPENKADDEEVIIASVPEKIVNYKITYPITITKTTITGDETVPGALIELYDEDGKVIYREFTDENGEIPDIQLAPGKYTFKEILAPEGYELNVAVMEFEVTDEGEIIGHTTITDDYTRVKFRKTDAQTDEPLEGAEFTLFNKDHEAVMKAVSDKDGLVVFEKIPYGEFTIEETKVVDGYDKREGSVCKAFVVDGKFINSKEDPAVVKNEQNTFFGLKVDQDNKPLAGATFGLFNEAGELLKQAVSDENGRFEFRKLTKGKYTVKEISAPSDEYLISRKVVTLELEEGSQSPAEAIGTWVNKLKRIRYIKVDTSGNYLEGVEFSLINAETEEVVEVVKSNDKGEFILTKFDYGDWIIRETKVPEGFNKMEDIHLHVDDDWTEPAPFTCVNIPNHYEFVKTDNKGNPLPGVKFTIEDSEGNVFKELVSGEDGIVRVTDLKPGKYVIREIETVEGFIRTDEAILVEINEKYVVPKEMYRLVNYPNIQTGVEIENPWLYGGAGVLGIALIALGIVLGKKKKKAKAEPKTEE